MNLLELNDAILYGEKTKIVTPKLSQDMLSTFQSLISSGQRIRMFYDQTDDVNSFFSLFPDVKQIVGTRVCVECFYACKLGYFMEGVPTKLTYIVQKMLSGEDNKLYVNRSMNAAVQLLTPYSNCEYEIAGECYTMKDVVENVVGSPIKLINSSVRKVKVRDVWEVFVPDANRVALLPDGIGSSLSMDDCENLRYVRDLGIALNDIPIRTLGNRVGIVRDDFDLRECV